MQEMIKELYHCIVILAIIQLCYSQNDLQNNKFVRKYSRYRYDRASLPDAVENNYEKYLKHPSSDTLNIRKRSTKVSIKRINNFSIICIINKYLTYF